MQLTLLSLCILKALNVTSRGRVGLPGRARTNEEIMNMRLSGGIRSGDPGSMVEWFVGRTLDLRFVRPTKLTRRLAPLDTHQEDAERS